MAILLSKRCSVSCTNDKVLWGKSTLRVELKIWNMFHFNTCLNLRWGGGFDTLKLHHKSMNGRRSCKNERKKLFSVHYFSFCLSSFFFLFQFTGFSTSECPKEYGEMKKIWCVEHKLLSLQMRFFCSWGLFMNNQLTDV